MNREEYMNILKEVLLGYNQEFATDVIKDYEDHFEISLKEGKSEEDICRELGDVNEAIEQLKQDFIDYKKQELIKLSKHKEEKKAEKQYEEQKNESTNDKASFESSKVKRLVLSLSFEDLFIEGISGDEILIEYEGKKAEKSFHCEQRGNTIYAESIRNIGQFKVNFFNFGLIFSKSATVRVLVPNYLEEIEIHTASGEVFIKGIDCKKLSYGGASGDVDVKKCSINKFEVKSISGDIQIENCASKSMKAKSMSGEIDILESQVENCLMESMSGDVTMKETVFQTVYGSSKSGDILVKLVNNLTGITVEASTIGGDTKVQYEGNRTNADLGTFKIVYGDGSCTIKASTISGDVTITD